MRAFNADVQSRVLILVRTILEQNAIAAQANPDSRRRGNTLLYLLKLIRRRIMRMLA
jgi:hypothetical protein